MAARHSFTGADISLDAPPRFDLGAVVEDPPAPANSGESPLTEFEEDPRNPRTDYVGADFEKLVESIRQLGVIVPVTVVRQDNGILRLVTGHRRFRAAKAAGLTHLKWVLAGETQTSLAAQFHENFIRADIEPMDKAKTISELIESGVTRRDVAGILGVDASVVTHLMALMKLPSFLQLLYDTGKCRQPKYLYDLRRLYEADPAGVERHCNEADVVDNKVLQELIAVCDAASQSASLKANGKGKTHLAKKGKQPPSGQSVSHVQFSYLGEPVTVLRIVAKLGDGKERELKGADLRKLVWAAAAD
jgi:ParB/RepB/Spo0J family partition protein